jgi:hypothetical protein
MPTPNPIRAAASAWLRKNEQAARDAIRDGRDLEFTFGWSPWRVNNMLSYLALVDEVAA